MAQQPEFRHMRRGMTLIELLMVVAIMTILMAVAIPAIRPAFQDRAMREAARQVNIFLSGAQARAAEIGRPVGVWIDVQGSAAGDKFAQRLSMAEVAPSFTGATVGARCTVINDTSTSRPLRFWTAWTPTSGQTLDSETTGLLNLLTDATLQEKFFIRFDHQGPLYQCANNGGTFQITGLPPGFVPRGTEDPGSGVTTIVPGKRPVGLTYEIIRSPSKSAVNTLTLPGDTVVDLTASGVGLAGDANGFNGATVGGRVIIMFAPSGKTGAVYVDNTEFNIGASIYLLIGRRAKVLSPINPSGPPDILPDAADPEKSNLADPANLWVTINNRTGAITTEDKAVAAGVPTTAAEYLVYLKATREFARSSQQKGGR